MSFSNDVNDRFFFSFTDTKDASSTGGVAPVIKQVAAGLDHDSGNVSYPDSTTEIYSFVKNSVTIRTITLVYTDSSKNFLSSWSVL